MKRSAAAAIAAPLFVPASALGKDGRAAPSDRIGIAGIGMGGRMGSHLRNFLPQKEVQWVAACDCFASRRKAAKAYIDKYYGNKDCLATRSHEEVLARKDVDAVIIATGDRWHAVLSALAGRAGKDVYCEKPFSLSIVEGRQMVGVMKRYGTVWQCGTQMRSNTSHRFVAEAVRGGRIGNLKRITAGLGGSVQRPTSQYPAPAPQPMPDADIFDYDRWLGQAPWAPYSSKRVGDWRNRWDTGGGAVCDLGAHYFDVAQWAHDSEETGPVKYEFQARWRIPGFNQMPCDFKVIARYADGVELIGRPGRKEMHFEGDEGWIHILVNGVITAKPASILADRHVPRMDRQFMKGHVEDFLSCIKTRELTAAHPQRAQKSHVICHCANIALRLRRPLKWDNGTGRFVDDDQANRLLARTMRAPWRI